MQILIHSSMKRYEIVGEKPAYFLYLNEDGNTQKAYKTALGTAFSVLDSDGKWTWDGPQEDIKVSIGYETEEPYVDEEDDILPSTRHSEKFTVDVDDLDDLLEE